jgi:hypothetical protein
VALYYQGTSFTAGGGTLTVTGGTNGGGSGFAGGAGSTHQVTY